MVWQDNNLLATTPASENAPCSSQIVYLQKLIAHYQSQQNQLTYARELGQDILDTLHEIDKQLDIANEYGTWDIFSGGNIILDIVKYRHLDKGQGCMSTLQTQIDAFQSQLQTVTLACEIDPIQLDTVTCFIDCVFDNIFSDCAFLNHVSESKTQISKLEKEVAEIVKQLDILLQGYRSEAEKWKIQLEEMLSTL